MATKKRAGRGARPSFQDKQATSQEAVLVELRRAARELVELQRRRFAAVAVRDRLVAQGRYLGVSWNRLAEASGVTRAALMQRDRRPL